MGSPEYVEAQRRLVKFGQNEFLRQIQLKRHADIDEWQTEMQLKSMRVGQVHLYTQGLNAEERLLTGVNMLLPSLDESVRDIVAMSSDRPSR